MHCLFILIALIAVSLRNARCLARSVAINDEFHVFALQGWYPLSLAIDASGSLWFNNGLAQDNVLQIDREGNHIASLTTVPFSIVSSVAVGMRDQIIYLADSRGKRVVLMTQDNFQIISLPYIMPAGFGVKQLLVDMHGVMFIIDDQSSSVVWRMAPDGSSLSSLVADPPIVPACMALDANNVLYVADQSKSQIFQFSSHGDVIGILSNSAIEFIISMTIDSLFNMYISFDAPDTGSELASGVIKLSADGVALGFYPEVALSMVVDPNDNSLYVSDFDQHITKFDSQLNAIACFMAPALLTSLNGMMLDPSGDGSLLALNGKSLLKVSPNGTVANLNVTQLVDIEVTSATIGSDKFVYVGGNNGDVLKLDADLTTLKSTPFGIAAISSFVVGPSGDLWYPDSDCSCVVVYSPDGVEQRRVLPGTDASGASMFLSPDGLFMDSQSNLFVLDQTVLMIYKLSCQGDLLWSFNLSDYTTFPMSFTVDMHGDVYVADEVGNHFVRIMLSDDGSVVDYIFDDILLASPTIAVNSDSVIYLADSISRIILLTPKFVPAEYHSNHLIIIVVVAVGCILLLIAGGAFVSHFVSSQKDICVVEEEIESGCEDNAEKESGCEERSTRHASRRDRTSRRGATVNFLRNYHDNLRLPVLQEDSADYVLYI